jgi:hypothetical protein
MKTLTWRAPFGVAILLFTAPLAQAGPTDKEVQKAIASACAYLQKSYRNGSGSGRVAGGVDGSEKAAALAGIAMLEAEVPLDDPTILAIAARIRELAPTETATYNMALDIIFLDKLEEPADIPLIQALGIRLLAGQNKNGGWTYQCPTPDGNETQRLRQMAANAGKGPAKKESGEIVGADPNNRPALSPEAKDMQNRLINNQNPGANIQGAPPGVAGPMDDNSNTQFAVLGLWTARRYGVQVDKALALTEERFRRTQSGDGGWSYMLADSSGVSASMTCAGLLALAAGRGTSVERQRVMRSGKEPGSESTPPKGTKDKAPPSFNPKNDPRIVAGLNYVGNEIAKDMGGRGPGMPPAVLPANLPPQMIQVMSGNLIHNDYYCLWSIERVGMIFGETRMGNVDWYSWGGQYLIANQNKQDGSWKGKWGADVDTSFGLMFLRRANLVKDLSDLMGNRVMRAGGKATAPRPGAAGTTEGSKTVEGTAPAATSTHDSDAQKLAKDLVDATGAKQLELIKEYAAAKGASYTEAFIEAIPQLSDNAKKTARECFAERMSRMSANTLKSRLQDKSPEMRRAAVLAVAMREEKGLIPDVIASLEDPEELVWRAAHLALRSLSEKDFGPAAGASPQDRAKAASAWKEWAKTQK